MAFIEWQPNSENEAKFQLVDTTVTAVTGLGSNFMFDICFPGTSVFIDGTGSKLEIGRGWYKYISPSAESAILGEVAVTASGVGTTQQNLTYQIGTPQMGFGATATTISVDKDGTPQDGAEVWVTSDAAGNKIVAGTLITNTEGNVTFYLDGGAYYVWAQKAGVNFDNPKAITV